MKNGIINSYNSLKEDIVIDVAIIGAGISGALTAYYLRNTGLQIAIFDRRHAGMGSTAASTAFLQYEIDKPLHELSTIVGEKAAVECYRLCRKAIYTIEKICKSLKPEFDFHIRPSLQYASFKKDINDLYKEYELRSKHGFDIAWLEQEDVRAKFGITAPAGILSTDGGEVDAYSLTHALLATVSKKGHSIYNNTGISSIEHNKHNVLLQTDTGVKIKAKKLIIACGYESLKYVPKKIAEIHTTYAIVSEPIDKGLLWHKDSLVWETANPYLYFRKVNGDRILVGGKDDSFHHPIIQNSVIRQKGRMLENSFNNRVAHIAIKADYGWGGAFAVTKDGLPYIGTFPERPHTFFSLGYGGNGITFSIIAAEILRDLLTGHKNVNANLFRFNR